MLVLRFSCDSNDSTLYHISAITGESPEAWDALHPLWRFVVRAEEWSGRAHRAFGVAELFRGMKDTGTVGISSACSTSAQSVGFRQGKDTQYPMSAATRRIVRARMRSILWLRALPASPPGGSPET